MTCIVKAFVGVIRRHRLEYLIHNKVVGGQEQVRRKSVAPKKLNIFSPNLRTCVSGAVHGGGQEARGL